MRPQLIANSPVLCPTTPPGRYMTWWWSPTWKEVGPRLLDWVINRLLKSSPGSLSNVVDHRLLRSALSDVQRSRCLCAFVSASVQRCRCLCPTSNDVGAGGNLAALRTSTDLSSLVNPSTPEFELRWLQRKTWPQQDTLFCHQGLSTRKNPANFMKSRWKVKR